MFKALYRKYRPKTFDDVVGQSNTVSILKNAIDSNKIAHAYLFYGPRGTGKTSIAKIFANEVNKNANYLSDSVDIIEIDAASNNGVDEIREIKEAIKFLPTEGSYKVYIIDEVHMLTTSAFNALLKTLEEPPSHIIFILATTEIHKIPATILSRCQKFEFKNLNKNQLIERLDYIASNENIKIDYESLEKIANIAKGGLRDAIGILDQVSNYNTNIKIQDILDITSSIGEKELLDFYKDLVNEDTSSAILKYNNFYADGKDTKLLIADLINISKDVLIYKNLKKDTYCEYNISELSELIENTSYDKIYKVIEILSEAENKIRFSTEYVSYLHVAIIKICSINIEDSSLTNLQDRLLQLEIKLKNLLDNKNSISNNVSEEKTLLKKDSVFIQKVKEENIEEYIIPNKNLLLSIMENSNEKFTNYAKKVYEKIVNSYLSTDKESFNLLKNCNLELSSKEGCILIFENDIELGKLFISRNYKKILEERFKNIIGVDYSVNLLQLNQYKYLKKHDKLQEEQKDKLEEKELVKSISKIEEIFSDIIIE
ncbi:DNA polymerase III subunit gamma/tau [Gemelliphila palaticanis]|uniref:DNA-directed DNA polymerase n=1 Tax=Gemelliphila palaticanis TaxID=81950 RepID=A0ABX2SZN3_9BACL|nr:DNA polymerase III subunit gamma/tau [Gemella palaticanis]MBF0715623.1 DNA polymerase III subunit gamma/tau [Gemella palaticanis]NYS47553.1 DNA polymerase III subunit gamma/tau [Gemella palaticanis]